MYTISVAFLPMLIHAIKPFARQVVLYYILFTDNVHQRDDLRVHTMHIHARVYYVQRVQCVPIYYSVLCVQCVHVNACI